MRPILLAALALALVAIPTASAHARYTTPDGKVTMVIGSLNEPVTTYVKSGLDLIVSDAHGQPVLGVQNTLSAVLIAPDNTTTMAAPLATQFGKPGSYSFNKPYVLTQPGQYRVHLSGTVNGTAVEGVYNVAGAIDTMESSTFPDQVPSLQTLAQQHAADQAKMAQLESRIAALETGKTSNASPLPLPIIAILGAALLALWRRKD